MISKRRITFAIAFLILLTGLFLMAVCRPGVVLAADTEAIAVEVNAGFDGKARAGSWIPVTVDLENRGPDFDGEVRISDPSGGSGPLSPMYRSQYVSDVVLPRGSHKRVTVYVPYFSAAPRLEVDLVSKGRTVKSVEVAVSSVGEQDLFIGVAGDRVSAWNLLTTLQLPSQRSLVEVVPVPAAEFPGRPEVLAAFDVIILGDVPAEALSESSLEALEGWVAGGGTLLLPGGANAKANLKGLPESLLPVVPGEAVQIGSITALEQLGSEPLASSLHPTITESRAVSGRVLAHEGGMPLAVLGSYGNGRVLFLAFDPAAQPLAGWSGMPRVWEELLFPSLPPSILSGSQLAGTGPLAATTQLLNNLSSAVYYLPALKMPSVNLLVGLIAAYILLVGPGTYLILRRLRRPGLAWVVIPVLVLLFSGSAYFLAVREKGSDLQVSAATIVERSSGTGWARVRQMVGVLAPGEGDYRVNLPGKAPVSAWNTNLNPANSDAGMVIRYRETASEVEMLGMGMWTMRGLWSDSLQPVDRGLLQNLYLEGDRLRGTVSNEGAVTLKEAWVVTGGVAHNLGELRPGASAAVDVQLVDAPAGSLFNYNFFAVGTPPPADPDERRIWQQRRQVLSAAMEGRDVDLPSGVCALLVGWTDERPPEITVNGKVPVKSSLTVFIDPVVPVVRGAFSLPGGMLSGQIIDVNTKIQDSSPGLLVFESGDVTFQFYLPENLVSLDRAAVQVPVSGGSSNHQGIQLLAYHWEDGTWDSLDLKTVNLQSQAFSSPGKAAVVVPARAPGVVTGPGRVTVYPTARYGIAFINFNEFLEGEMSGQGGLSGYISDSGLVRVRLALEDGVTVQTGMPSLALEGVADD